MLEILPNSALSDFSLTLHQSNRMNCPVKLVQGAPRLSALHRGPCDFRGVVEGIQYVCGAPVSAFLRHSSEDRPDAVDPLRHPTGPRAFHPLPQDAIVVQRTPSPAELHARNLRSRDPCSCGVPGHIAFVFISWLTVLKHVDMQVHYGLYTEWLNLGGLHPIPDSAKHGWLALLIVSLSSPCFSCLEQTGSC